MKNKCYKAAKALISVLLSLIMTLLMLPPLAFAEEGDETEEIHESRIVVSMGDSYASGEGIDDFYGSDLPLSEKVKNEDWLGHRSENSWSGMLSLPGMDGYNGENLNTYGKTLKDYKSNYYSCYEDGGFHWYFVASSGATTHDITNDQSKPYNKYEYEDAPAFRPAEGFFDRKDFKPNEGFDSRYGHIRKLIRYNDKDKTLQPQITVLNDLKAQGIQVDYVTLSIGGNDANFVDIVSTAVWHEPAEAVINGTVSTITPIGMPKYFSPNILATKINKVWDSFYDENDGIGKNLVKTYKKISEATDDKAQILVTGYPQLLSTDGSVLFFSKEDASLINNAVTQFNEAIRCKIKESNKSNIHFVSVEEAFEGHEAYTDNPYINKVMLGIKEQDLDDRAFPPISAYSMHPNYDGARAYAECVQREIAAIEEGKSEASASYYTSDERDIVLVIDNSGSMNDRYEDGTVPIEETKKAASKFVDTVLQKDAGVGIVGYSSSAEIKTVFSNSKGHLNKTIEDLSANGGTNIYAGLEQAYNLLHRSNAKKKIIVLMSDGCPNQDLTGEDLINYAGTLKNEGIIIYSLGFFGALSEGESATAQDLMRRIASDDNFYFNVDNSENLVFFFDDLAEMLNGTHYIYVRIACPVDVTVEYGGEKLCSKNASLNTRTSFGSLTFEDNAEEENEREDGETGMNDDRIKILRLKEGTDYNIKVEGNGKGKMTYSIGFMDENGDYSDMRRFSGIKINKSTVIDTVAAVSDTTVLSVDENGDGKYDLVYKAGKNGTGKPVDYSIMTYLCIAAGALLLLLILMIVIKVKYNKRLKAKMQ